MDIMIGAILETVFGSLAEAVGVSQWIRERLGRDPEKLAFRMALTQALADVGQHFPGSDLRYFAEALRDVGGPLLARYVQPAAALPTAAELTDCWLQHLNLDSPLYYRADFERFSDLFLGALQSHLENQPALQWIAQLRTQKLTVEAVQRSAEASEQSAATLVALKADLHQLTERLQQQSQIASGGGAVNMGRIEVGGNFVGRDQITTIHNYFTVGLQRLPIDHIDLDNANARLAELPLEQVPDVAPPPAGSHMPLGNSQLFVGRTEELRQLAAWLKAGETASVGQIAAVTGMGGVGKTQLATSFVHRYGQYFLGGVFWLSFADPDSIAAQIIECGAKMPELQAIYHLLDVETQRQRVLTAWQSPMPRLLIFDSCEDPDLLDQWQPTIGGCRILVTSRRAQWDVALGVQTLALDTLLRPQSLELLHKYSKLYNKPAFIHEDEPVLDAIAEKLGDLPLALHLVGSYLGRYRQAVTPEEYLKQLDRPDLLKHRSLAIKDRARSPTKHEQNVERTFALSYEQLDTENPIDALAMRLLAHIACFAPGELIPRDLLLQTISPEDGVSGNSLNTALQFEDALYRLTELGLIEEETSGQIVLHRLLVFYVQEVDTNIYKEVVKLVEAALLDEAKRLNNTRNPQLLLAWEVHLRYCTDLAKMRIDETAAELCYTLGEHLVSSGKLWTAKSYYERALTICRDELGGKSLLTADIIYKIGELLFILDEPVELKSYVEQAVDIYAELLAQTNLVTQEAFEDVNLFIDASQQDDLDTIKRFFIAFICLFEKIYGWKHHLTANGIYHLGTRIQ